VQEKDSEELALIIDHEKVHARQWHSVDLLLSHVYRAFFWWNPLAWIVKTQIGENLEFIADSHAKSRHAHGHTYERALLSRAASHMQPALANNFFTPFIKQRIVMLQKEASATWNAYKYALILPVMLVFIYSFNRVQEIEYVQKEVAVVDPKLEGNVAELYTMLVGNDAVEEITELNEITIELNAYTTPAQLKEYAKGLSENGDYDVRFTEIKTNNAGKVTGFVIATKYPSQSWNNDVTVKLSDAGKWLITGTKEVVKLTNAERKQTLILSKDGTKLETSDENFRNELIQVDSILVKRARYANGTSLSIGSINDLIYSDDPVTGDELTYARLNKENHEETFEVPVNKLAIGYAETKPKYTIFPTMTRDAVREVVQSVNDDSDVQLELATLRYKNGKISKIKLKATKNGTEQIVASESNKGINTICMQVTKEQVLFVKCANTVYYSLAGSISYLQDSKEETGIKKNTTDKKSGHLYYQNGTYSYVSENGETKIFNSWGVQVHSIDFIISSGRAANGKTTINNKPYAFTVDKNGALEFINAAGNVVKENLLTGVAAFPKSQNIVLPASSDKNFNYLQEPRPLIVLDGTIVAYSILKNVDPADIKGVTVLKDKAATAIYGDAGENGVLEITTKGAQKQLQNEVNANQATSKNLKDFKIVFEKSARGIQMRSLQGTAWIDLSFSLENNKPQAINEYGMTTLQKGASSKDAALANFLFTITKTENGITLKGIEGTVWTGLSFSLTKNSKQVVNQYGVTTID